MCGDMEKYIGKWNTITTGINDGMQGVVDKSLFTYNNT